MRLVIVVCAQVGMRSSGVRSSGHALTRKCGRLRGSGWHELFVEIILSCAAAGGEYVYSPSLFSKAWPWMVCMRLGVCTSYLHGFPWLYPWPCVKR